MPATLTPKAEELFDSLPPYYENDPMTQAVLGAVGAELQRIENYLQTIRDKIWWATADDEYGFLGLWEARVGLPVEPEGISIEARRAKVGAAVQRRSEGAGEGWVNVITTFLGTPSWSHEEQRAGDYRLAIDIPVLGAYTEEQLANFLALVRPAHLQIDLAIAGVTFQVGVSAVGDAI